jgi:hypothetical protein
MLDLATYFHIYKTTPPAIENKQNLSCVVIEWVAISPMQVLCVIM